MHLLQAHKNTLPPLLYTTFFTVLHTKVNTTAVAFWKNDSNAGHELREINSTNVGTKPWGIKVTCIVSGDKGWPTKVCTMSNENLGSGLQMKLVVCVYIVTKTLTYWAKFNYYKLTKSTWLVPWLWVKIRTWWVKRREGRLIEGVIFKVCSTWCTSFSSSETWLLSKLFSLSRASFLVAASISLASSDCTYCTRGGRGL